MRKIDVSKIEISADGCLVRYDGKVQHKVDLSYLIHQIAFMVGNSNWPLWSDIYWDSALVSELVADLKYWLSKCN